MLTPASINLVTFFYPLGNTPAVCLTQDLPFEQKADILLLGCGDVRHILFTTYSNNVSPPRSLDITCCDAERAVLARNILLFTTLIDDVDGQNHPYIWQMYYHFFLDSKSLELVQSQSAKLWSLSDSLQSWYGSIYGKVLRFYDQETLDAVRQVWKAYSTSNLTTVQMAEYDVRFKAALQKSKYAKTTIMGTGAVTTGLRSAAPTSLQALRDLPELFEYFWKHGTTDVSPVKLGEQTHSNPTFAPLETDVFTLHYGIDPLHGFPLATAYIPLTRDSPLRLDQNNDPALHKATEAARVHFLEWSKSFRNHSPHLVIRFFTGDALAFCHTLQGKQALGNTTSHWYRTSYSLKPLILDDDKLNPLYPAPLSFDVIDTSNLADHLGAINVLTAASPLLKKNVSASLFTESLVMREATRKDLMDNLLCGHFATMSILFNLIPVEYWTNATAVSTADEAMLSATTEFLNNSLGINQNVVKGQMRCRMTWKGGIPVSGDSDDHALHFEARDLALMMFKVYQSMFQHENLEKALSSPSLMMLRKNSCPTYHRGSFAALLKFIKSRVEIDWAKMMHILLSQIEEDTTLLVGRNYIQELYLQLHCFQVYSTTPLRPNFRHIKSEGFLEGMGAWKNKPAVVCLTLEVPRARLGVFTSMDPVKLASPIVHGVVQSSVISMQRWQNIFANVHLSFGRIVTSGARSHDDFRVSVEEDSQGWTGTCPLLVCFYVPAWMILLDPQATTVAFGVQSTPQSAISFSNALGLDMNVFSTPLTSERHVYISRYAPNHSGYPLAAQFAALQPKQTPKSGSLVNIRANIEESTARIQGLTGRVENFTEDIKSTLLAGAAVKIVQPSPFALCIHIGESRPTYTVQFPAPVLKQGSKIRVARKSGYIEVIAPIANAGAGNEFPFFMYPICLHKDRVVICNMPYVKMQHLPIIDITEKEKLEWLNILVALQLSRRERVLRDKVDIHRDIRLNYKDSLFSIFMHFSGLQEGKSATFAINLPNRGGVHILVFVACLRLDLSNHTVILDSAVLPLTDRIMPAISGFLKMISENGICTINVDDDELRLWRELLPVLVERCREWEHFPNCEYIKSSRIPLSTSDGQQIICSCGYGIFPQDFILGVPGWEVVRKYAVRAAISPSFSVPYIERAVEIQDILETAGNRCEKCKKESLNGAKLMKCSRCKRAWYCSAMCQRADYREHKRLCRLTKLNSDMI